MRLTSVYLPVVLSVLVADELAVGVLDNENVGVLLACDLEIQESDSLRQPPPWRLA
jgi:hypothetical protein